MTKDYRDPEGIMPDLTFTAELDDEIRRDAAVDDAEAAFDNPWPSAATMCKWAAIGIVVVSVGFALWLP